MSHRETDEPGPSHAAGPSHNALSQNRKGKGKYPAISKGPVKRKVKEHRLRVVGLTKMCYKMPVGAMRESKMKSVWIHENAVAEEVARRICETFNWNYDTSSIQYM